MLYKDCAIPSFYHLFTPDAKIVVIGRSEAGLLSSNGLKHLGYDFNLYSLREARSKYSRLVSEMIKERDVLEVNYNAFGDNFYKEAQRVCDFLDVEPFDGLHEVYKPRRK